MNIRSALIILTAISLLLSVFAAETVFEDYTIITSPDKITVDFAQAGQSIDITTCTPPNPCTAASCVSEHQYRVQNCLSLDDPALLDGLASAGVGPTKDMFSKALQESGQIYPGFCVWEYPWCPQDTLCKDGKCNPALIFEPSTGVESVVDHLQPIVVDGGQQLETPDDAGAFDTGLVIPEGDDKQLAEYGPEEFEVDKETPPESGAFEGPIDIPAEEPTWCETAEDCPESVCSSELTLGTYQCLHGPFGFLLEEPGFDAGPGRKYCQYFIAPCPEGQQCVEQEGHDICKPKTIPQELCETGLVDYLELKLRPKLRIQEGWGILSGFEIERGTYKIERSGKTIGILFTQSEASLFEGASDTKLLKGEIIVNDRGVDQACEEVKRDPTLNLVRFAPLLMDFGGITIIHAPPPPKEAPKRVIKRLYTVNLDHTLPLFRAQRNLKTNRVSAASNMHTLSANYGMKIQRDRTPIGVFFGSITNSAPRTSMFQSRPLYGIPIQTEAHQRYQESQNIMRSQITNAAQGVLRASTWGLAGGNTAFTLR